MTDLKPLIFEPHGAFRSNLAVPGCDGDWPLGYVSKRPGEVVLVLSEPEWSRSDLPTRALFEYGYMIAAAPELLEALEDAVEIIDDQLGGDFPDSLATFRAVIAKARGDA